MFKKSKIFLAITLVLLMSFTSITTALANLNPNQALVTDDEDSPVQATITKELRLPIGTTTPDVTFNFDVEKVSVDGRTTPNDLATMPSLNPAALAVSFSSADTADIDLDSDDPLPNIISFIRETGDLFDGDVRFPHAGIFVYIITERIPVAPDADDDDDDDDDDDGDTANELWYYSKARYKLTVHVANHSNGTTYVRALGTERLTTDHGNELTGVKVDPTPGGDGVEYFFSQMKFTNEYVKIDAPIDPNPHEDATLFVRKNVAGDFGDRSMLFNFTMSLTIPEIVRTAELPPYFKAFVIENGRIIDPADNVDETLIGGDIEDADDDDDEENDSTRYIMVPFDGTAFSFRLRHGQKLVFVDTPIGTQYDVAEAQATNYTTNILVTTPGGVRPSLNIPGLVAEEQHVGYADSSAVFTNTRASVTPTGLNLNDLPFIGLIVLALGALSIFVVLKVRKRNYD